MSENIKKDNCNYDGACKQYNDEEGGEEGFDGYGCTACTPNISNTRQCKELIIQYLKDNPSALNKVFPPFPANEDPDGTEYEEFLEMIYNIENWSFHRRAHPKSALAEDLMFLTRLDDNIPEDIECITEYACDPLESQLNFSLLEMKDGSLQMVGYTGD